MPEHPAKLARDALLRSLPDSGWLPTAANINALPEPIFKYVAGLETIADPQYIIRENTLLRDENDQLRAYIKEALNG